MIVRMATLSSGGRIDLETVREELARSRKTRPLETQPGLADLLGPDYAERFDCNAPHLSRVALRKSGKKVCSRGLRESVMPS